MRFAFLAQVIFHGRILVGYLAWFNGFSFSVPVNLICFMPVLRRLPVPQARHLLRKPNQKFPSPGGVAASVREAHAGRARSQKISLPCKLWPFLIAQPPGQPDWI
jgi:hypothetical protein